jgi:hypothetical protein
MTKIINFFGGPGCGKSTVSAGLFYKMKLNNINAEYVQEFAKDLTWEERKETLNCQPYVFGKQLLRINRLIGKVDFIITDSPLLLSAVYECLMENNPVNGFADSVLDTFLRFNNINYVIYRTKPYNPLGRNQTEEESKGIDSHIRNFLAKHNIAFKETMGLENSVEIAYEEAVRGTL